MKPPGGLRGRLADLLNGAFADGLLSERTLQHRLAVLLGARLLDPEALIGDLVPRRRRTTIGARARALWGGAAGDAPPTLVLALDWEARGDDGLVIGRSAACDVVVDEPTVSRRHARLRFRDGVWTIQDLGSTNGTTVNRVPVGRAPLHPGDRLALGMQRLEID